MKIQENELFNGRYRLISEKGRGAFGEVWLAHDEQTDLDVAIKIYIALDERGIEDFKSEYKTAYSLNHPNLLHASYFDVIEKRPFLVMSFCPGSAEDNIGTTDENLIWRFIKDVSSGLAYLHSKDIIHRDIKPDNVLVDAEGNFLITDFGVSTKMKSTLRRNSTRSMTDGSISGTIGYMAPELFTKNPEAVKATDIWALGATLFEMINGELPFFGQGGIMLERGAEIPELKGQWSNYLRHTIEACLAKEPWNRPTAAQLEAYATKCVNGDFEKVPWKEPEGETSVDTDKTIRATSGTAKTTALTEKKRKEQCITCLNRKESLKDGLHCGLTDNKPDYKTNCENFEADEKEVERRKQLDKDIKKEDRKKLGHAFLGGGVFGMLGVWASYSYIGVICLGLVFCILGWFASEMDYFLGPIFSIIYLALFILIGVKSIIAYKKEQENTIALGTTFWIMMTLAAAYSIIVQILSGQIYSRWFIIALFCSALVIWRLHSSEMNDDFPKDRRKWHKLEKIILAFTTTLFIALLIVPIAAGYILGNDANQTPVETSQKAQTTETSSARPSQEEKATHNATTKNETNGSKDTAKDNAGLDSENQDSIEDNASKLQKALKKGDYSTVKKLADSGYVPAYLPLAKYYLKSPLTHQEADKYAKKAKRAGVNEAQKVIDDLQALGFYD